MRGGAERERGALLLSYVIIVPVFLLMIMFIVQASMWFLARSAALAAARQGVDAARVPHGTLAGGVAAAESFARSSASDRAEILGSSALMASTLGRSFLTSRSPSNFVFS